MEKGIYFNGLAAPRQCRRKGWETNGQQQGNQPDCHQQFVEGEASIPVHTDLLVLPVVSCLPGGGGNRSIYALKAKTDDFGAEIHNEMRDIVCR